MAEDNRNETLRFKTLASRLSTIQVNAARSLRHAGVLDPKNRDESWLEDPLDDLGGNNDHFSPEASAAAQASAVLANRSLFAQELGRCVTSFRERRFGLLYFDLKQRVESLPELLHHLPYVVAALVAGLHEVATCTPGTPAHLSGAPRPTPPVGVEPLGNAERAAQPLLQLIAVLATECQTELWPEHAHSLIGAVCGVVSGDAPELCGHAFRCLSYVLKGLATPLSEDPGQLRRYYGPLLGHGRDFVRRFAAETFAPVVRRLKPKALQRHLRQVLKALLHATAAASPSAAAVEDGAPNVPLAEVVERLCGRAVADNRAVVDGVAQLYFEVAKGTGSGELHSRASDVFNCLLANIVDPPVSASSSSSATSSTASEGAAARFSPLASAVAGAVGQALAAKLCAHLRPVGAGPFWEALLPALARAARRLSAALPRWSAAAASKPTPVSGSSSSSGSSRNSSTKGRAGRRQSDGSGDVIDDASKSTTQATDAAHEVACSAAACAHLARLCALLLQHRDALLLRAAPEAARTARALVPPLAALATSNNLLSCLGPAQRQPLLDVVACLGRLALGPPTGGAQNALLSASTVDDKKGGSGAKSSSEGQHSFVDMLPTILAGLLSTPESTHPAVMHALATPPWAALTTKAQGQALSIDNNWSSSSVTDGFAFRSMAVQTLATTLLPALHSDATNNQRGPQSATVKRSVVRSVLSAAAACANADLATGAAIALQVVVHTAAHCQFRVTEDAKSSYSGARDEKDSDDDENDDEDEELDHASSYDEDSEDGDDGGKKSRLVVGIPLALLQELETICESAAAAGLERLPHLAAAAAILQKSSSSSHGQVPGGDAGAADVALLAAALRCAPLLAAADRTWSPAFVRSTLTMLDSSEISSDAVSIDDSVNEASATALVIRALAVQTLAISLATEEDSAADERKSEEESDASVLLIELTCRSLGWLRTTPGSLATLQATNQCLVAVRKAAARGAGASGATTDSFPALAVSSDGGRLVRAAPAPATVAAAASAMSGRQTPKKKAKGSSKSSASVDQATAPTSATFPLRSWNDLLASDGRPAAAALCQIDTGRSDKASNITKTKASGGGPGKEEADDLVAQMLPNLHHENHRLRRATLRFLTLLEDGAGQPPVRSKHGSARGAGDQNMVDDEGASAAAAEGAGAALKLCLELERLPLTLAREREHTLKLTNLAVLASNGLLGSDNNSSSSSSSSSSGGDGSSSATPASDTRAAAMAASHCLGLLQRKFQPLWEPASTTFAALALARPDVAWPPLLALLTTVCRRHRPDTAATIVGADAVATSTLEVEKEIAKQPASGTVGAAVKAGAAAVEQAPQVRATAALQCELSMLAQSERGGDGGELPEDGTAPLADETCVAFGARTELTMAPIEENSSNSSNKARSDAVSTAAAAAADASSSATDLETLFGLVLRCAGGAPELVRRWGSRAVVALFLEFMAVDFFGCFYDDPDHRELGLIEHLEDFALAEVKQATVEAGGGGDDDDDGDESSRTQPSSSVRQQKQQQGLLLEQWSPAVAGAPSPNALRTQCTMERAVTAANSHASGEANSNDGVVRPFSLLRPAEVWRRLSSWLSLWDCIGAPKSLAKHQVLLQVFVRLLAKPKAGIASAALACVRAYKLPYLQPYDAQLRALVANEGSATSTVSGNSHGASSSSGNGVVKAHLRDSLVLFSLHAQGGDVAPPHRAGLVPVLARIVYGRLIARGGRTATAKDTPAARRAAILAFVSHLDGETELQPFIFLMVRSFVPAHVPLATGLPLPLLGGGNSGNKSGKSSHSSSSGEQDPVVEEAAVVARALAALENLRAADLVLEGGAPAPANTAAAAGEAEFRASGPTAVVSLSRQVGFLTLLRALVAKLGHTCVPFLPHFMRVLLAVLHNSSEAAAAQDAAVAAAAASAAIASVNDDDEEDDDDNDDDDDNFDEVAAVDAPMKSKHDHARDQVLTPAQARERAAATAAAKVRGQCLRAMTALLAQFGESGVHVFTRYAEQLWPALLPALNRLPRAGVLAGRQAKPPALAIFLHALSAHPKHLPLLAAAPDVPLSVPQVSPGPSSSSIVAPTAPTNTTTTMVSSAHGSAALMALIACLSAGADTGAGREADVSAGDRFALNGASSKSSSGGSSGSGRPFGAGLKAVKGCGAPVLELVFGCLEHLLASPAGRQLLRPLLPAAVAHLAVRGSKGLTGGTHRIEAREVVLLCNLADFAVDGSADEDALPPPSSSKSKKGVHKEVRAEAKVHDDDEDNEEDALGGGGGDGWGGRSAAAQRAKAWAATVDPQTSQQLATLLLGLLTKRFQALHHSDRNGSSSGGGGLSGGFESIGGGSGATFTGVASHLPPADRLKLHALRVLAALVPALPNPNRVILFLAKLLGPSPGAGSDKSRSSSSGGGGFGSELALRTGAIRLLRVCARHPTLQGKLGPAVHVVRSLGATTLAAVKGTTLKAEERDYARCVPAYAALASSLTKKKQALGDDDDDAGDGASNFGSRANKLMARVGGVVATDIDSDEAKGVAWEELFRAEEEHERAQATASVLPEAGARSSSGAMTYMGVSLVIAQCLHGLYDEEVAIRAAAVAALRALVQVLAQGPAKLPAEPAATPAAAAAAAEKTPRSSKKSSKKNIAAEEGAVPSSATPSKRTAAHTSANLAALREARFSALRTFLLPGLKAGLRSPNDAARKGMLAVIAELVRQFHAHEHGSSTSPVVSINSSKLAGSSSSTMSASSVAAFEVPFVDLQSLLHDEDPEMDFFLNVCHVQVHRRARAFKRLANLLDQKVVVAPAAAAAMETTDSRGTGRGTGKGKAADNISSSSSAAEDIQPYAWAISPSSIAHVLLPLAMHPLHESGISGTKAVAADVLLPDALQAITSLCKRLPWGKYAATLRLLVGQLERHVKAEAKLRGNGGVVMEVSEGLSSSNSGSGGSSGQHERDLKERALASGVCAVLDGFHFEVSEADVAAVRTSSLSSWKVKAKSADSKPGQSKDSEGQEVDDENKMNVDSEGTAAAEGGSQDDKVDEEEEKVGDEDEKDDDEEEGKEDDEVDNDDAEEEDASNKVWAALEDKFLPQLQKLVLKQKVGRRGEKQVGLRSNVATAVLKLVLRLPPQARNKQLPQLVGTVTNELRSKHQDARDGARSAMANMARDLGPLHLPLLLSSLRARLTHGYMLHVRAAALHAMLLSLTKKYSAPGQGTAAAITAAPPATTTAAAAVAVVASSSTTNSSSHKGGSRSEDDDGRYPVLPLPELARLADLRASLKHPSIAERAQASRHEWSAAAFEAAGSKGRGGKGKGGKGKGKGKGKGGKGTEEEVAADPFKDGRGSGLYAGLEKPGVPLSAVLPPLDACTDKIMRLCLEDLFGEAAESKEAQDVLKNEVKEAKGAKTYDVIEMLAKAVLFRPSYVLLANSSVDLGGALDASAVHALVTPLVARLNRPQHLHASAKDAAKATAALERVASGLAANPSVDPRELLLYVYSTCAPFVKSRFGGRRTATGSSASVDEATPGGGESGGSSNDDDDSSESEEEEEGNDDDEDDEEKLEWTAKRMNVAPKTPNASKSDLKAAGAAATAGAAVATPSLSKSARKRQSEARRAQRQLSGTTWLPSMNAGDRLREGGGGVKSMVGHTAALALSGALPTSMPSKANGNNSGGGSGGGAATAVAGLRSPVSKKARKYASVQVLDGAQAPKLTGRDRLTSHHRPGEMPGQDGGPQVKGMVVNDDDDDEGGGNGSGSNGISQLNEAAAHGTVHFALSVFYAHLRKGCLSPHALGVGESGSGSGGSGGGSGFGFAKASPEVLRDVLAMAEPFLPLLNHCARAAVSDDRVRLLALKCLGLLLKWPLSGISKYARRLGKGLLKLLTWASGSGSGEGSGSSSAGVVASRSELVQGCFKGLTTLLYFDPTEAYAAGGSALGLTKSEGGDSSANFAVTADLAAAAAACLQQQQQQLALTDGSSDGTAARAKSQQQHKGPKVALSAAQMKALVRVLHHSLLDASHQSSSFQLVRALVHQRVVVSEMYDLMDRMASANVTASRLPVRQQAGHIFVRFLLFYPMGPKRLDHHIKQALGNLQYVHASGRLSGIELVAGLCSHLPTPVLDEHAQLLMLPLVLRVANDPDPVCRKACLAAIRTLLGRCSAAAFAQLWELVAGWLNAGQKETGGGEARDGDGLDKEVKGAKRRHEGSDGDSRSETEEVTGGAAAAATDAGAGVSSPSSSSSSPVLEATAAQVAGACIEARPDLMKRNGRATALVLGLRSCLRKHLAREQKLLARDADTAARAKARAQSQTSKAAAAAVASRDDDDEEDGGWQSAELAWSNTHSNSESGEGSDDDDEEEDLSDDGDDNDQEGASGYLPPWTVCYHALLCLERCTKALPSSSDAAARSFQSQPSAQFARATAARVLAIQAGTEEAEVERGYGPQPATEPVDNEEAGWFWSVVAEALVMGHPWVRLAAARVLGLYFSRRSPQRLVLSSGDSNNKSTGGSTGAGGGGDNDGSGGEYLASPGTLFRLARLTLTQLDEPDGANGARGEFLAPPLAEQAVKNLVFLANAMRHHPHLCNKAAVSLAAGRSGDESKRHRQGAAAAAAENDDDNDDEEDDDEDDNASEGENSDEEETAERSSAAQPATAATLATAGSGGANGSDAFGYLMRRTNPMSRRRGDDRRAAIFQWFGAFAATQPLAVVQQHLTTMVDALYRAKVDGQSAAAAAGGGGGGYGKASSEAWSQDSHRGGGAAAEGGIAAAGGDASGGGGGGVAESTLAVPLLIDEVFELLEDKVGASTLLAARAEVQQRFDAKRDRRKRARAAAAVTDPESYAAQKLARNRQKKDGEKRRKRAFGEMRKAGGSRGKGKGKGKGKGGGHSMGNSGPGLQHLGGGFGRKRPKG